MLTEPKPSGLRPRALRSLGRRRAQAWRVLASGDSPARGELSFVLLRQRPRREIGAVAPVMPFAEASRAEISDDLDTVTEPAFRLLESPARRFAGIVMYACSSSKTSL